ncbi:hypothetical protein HKD37_19G052686 [Glycine soja]
MTSSFKNSSSSLHFRTASFSPAAFPHCRLRPLLLPSSRMPRSRPSSSCWTSLNEELEQLLATVPKLTIEEHGEWRKMTNMMQNVVVPLETIFQTIHARDQIFGEVSKVYAVRWKDILDCNAGLRSIIGGRHLKLELDGNISAKPCP